jgi:putative DNA primase/helicase
VANRSNGAYEAALSYAEHGIYTNPVYVQRGPDGKKQVRPIGRWRETSTISKADIYAWWGPGQEHEHAGILIDCGKSRLVVVDPDGQEGVVNWLALNPPNPLGITKTPGGGEHWYYRAHPDHPIGNDQDGKVAPKVDVRGLGGFVIAPPTSDGTGAWEWVAPPDWTASAMVPDLVIERMTAREAAGAGVSLPTTPAADNDLFDETPREFTEEQAVEFVKAAMERLAGTKQGFNGAINNFAMACAHFPWRVDRDLCGRLMIKALKPVTGWTEPDRQDRMTIESAYAATEAGKSWVAVKREAATEVVSSETPGAPLDVLPPPSDPHRVARELLGQMEHTGGHLHRAWWRGDFYRWTGTHWSIEDLPVMERWLYQQTADAAYLAPGKDGGFERKPWAPTRLKIGNLAHALGVGLLQRTEDDDRVVACTNGVVDVADRCVREHHPSTFNLSSLPFPYDPGASCPEWLAFLESSLPGDREAHDFLAEWFGYVLSGRTDMHKIGVLVGPPRCGKGTISRVLKAMVGTDGWAAPTLARLGGNFGMESLIGKSLAVMGDVRWTSKHVIEAVPVMLGVSGEDGFSVPRKNREDWIGKLGARLMLMSNDAPVFTDASGALAGRMVYVAFRRSFLGKEDLGLQGRVMGELSGILNWALDGLERLDKQGFFTQSAGSLELRDEVERDSSPVTAWVDDRCVLDPTAVLTLDALLSSYRDWLTAENMPFSPSLNRLSRELRSAFGDQGVTIDRKSNGHGGKHRVVTGIRPLAGGSIPDDDLFD